MYARAATACHMYYLDSKDILSVMADFPEYDEIIRGRVLGTINNDSATIAVHRRKSLIVSEATPRQKAIRGKGPAKKQTSVIKAKDYKMQLEKMEKEKLEDKLKEAEGAASNPESKDIESQTKFLLKVLAEIQGEMSNIHQAMQGLEVHYADKGEILKN